MCPLGDVYRQPEIAHVGLYESGGSGQRHYNPASTVDRAITDGEEMGLRKVLSRGEVMPKFLGDPHGNSGAGEMRMSGNHNVNSKQNWFSKLAAVIHPYPTQGFIQYLQSCRYVP
jgi:pyruvate/2-oxoglutarate dehydrogenase complex dihydrolipoamide dehydrogenase (E3) component